MQERETHSVNSPSVTSGQAATLDVWFDAIGKSNLIMTRLCQRRAQQRRFGLVRRDSRTRRR